MVDTFEQQLSDLINHHSKENESNTPDWVLANYLIGCLASFNMAVQRRENWYGRDPRPSMPSSRNTTDKHEALVEHEDEWGERPPIDSDDKG